MGQIHLHLVRHYMICLGWVVIQLYSLVKITLSLTIHTTLEHLIFLITEKELLLVWVVLMEMELQQLRTLWLTK